MESKIQRRKRDGGREDELETFMYDTVHLVSIWVVNVVRGCISLDHYEEPKI